MHLSARDKSALAEVRKTHPDMTEEEYLQTLDIARQKIRRAMFAKGFTEYGDMSDDDLSDRIADAMLAERERDDAQ